MDNDAIKTYTDNKTYEDMFNNVFSKFHTYLKTQGPAILIKFIDYSEGAAAFKINHSKVDNNCIILTRDNSNNTIFAYLVLEEKKEGNIYIFKPTKIQVNPSPRKEERKILDTRINAKHRIYIINMISEFIIKNSLDLYKKKISQIEHVIKVKLDKYFKHIRIYFIYNSRDYRMDYFKKNIRPIYIENINGEPREKDREIFNIYKTHIFPEDIYLKNKEVISEISVPIVFNMKIPYGFIQVNNPNPFNESSLQIVKKMAVITNELLKKNNIFPKAEEKISVIDISKSGIGVIFKDKKCMKYFSENQLVYYDLLLPDNKKVNILSSVQNILIKGSIYRVGCKIIEIDALSEVYYDEYLESIGIKVE